MKRYLRQIALPEFGQPAQAALARSRVLIVGCGGLGAAVAPYLAAAGVGSLTLVDGDRVELSNLPRQLWFDEANVGRLKAECAAERLCALNSAATIRAITERIEAANALEIATGHDLIVDCVDDFETKQLLNEAAYRLDVPLLFGSVVGFDGMAGSFHPRRGACLHCLFPFHALSAQSSCELNGVLGPSVGVVGAWQSLEAIRVLAREAADPAFAPRFGMIWNMDLRDGSTRSFAVPRRHGCVCDGRTQRLSAPLWVLEWRELGNGDGLCLLDVREPEEFAQGSVPSARNWPLSRLEQGLLPAFLPESAAWALFCARGARSKRAVELLLTVQPRLRAFSIRGGLEERQKS